MRRTVALVRWLVDPRAPVLGAAVLHAKCPICGPQLGVLVASRRVGLPLRASFASSTCSGPMGCLALKRFRPEVRAFPRVPSARLGAHGGIHTVYAPQGKHSRLPIDDNPTKSLSTSITALLQFQIPRRHPVTRGLPTLNNHPTTALSLDKQIVVTVASRHDTPPPCRTTP